MGTVTFRAKGGHYRLVRTPADRYRDSRGDQQSTPSDAFEFDDNGVLVLDEERDEDLDWLRGHPSFGQAFVEVAIQDGELSPPVDELISKIIDAAQVGDAETITKIRAAEERTHRRPVVINAASAASAALNSGNPDGAAEAVGEAQAGSPPAPLVEQLAGPDTLAGVGEPTGDVLPADTQPSGEPVPAEEPPPVAPEAPAEVPPEVEAPPEGEPVPEPEVAP